MSEVKTQRDSDDAGYRSIDTVCETIIDALADAEDISPMELDPLYDSIDPDALGRLLDSADSDLSVTFTHGACRVQVFHDGTVVVDDAADDGAY